MPWNKLELSDDEVSELKEFMKETRNKQEYRRALVVLMRRKYTCRKIAEELDVALSTVYRAEKRYKEGGIDGLRNKPRGGRKPRITEEERKRIIDVALKSPRSFGYLRNIWSIRALARFLTEEVGITISKSHVHRILNESGIVFKRPKISVESPDKDYERRAKTVGNLKDVADIIAKKGTLSI